MLWKLFLSLTYACIYTHALIQRCLGEKHLYEACYNQMLLDYITSTYFISVYNWAIWRLLHAKQLWYTYYFSATDTNPGIDLEFLLLKLYFKCSYMLGLISPSMSLLLCSYSCLNLRFVKSNWKLFTQSIVISFFYKTGIKQVVCIQ